MPPTTLDSAFSNLPFYRLPKPLIKAVGLDAAVLLTDLISRRSYWGDRGELQADGTFFVSNIQLEDATCLPRGPLYRAKKTLKDFGLLKVTVRGVPAVSYYSISDEKVLQLLQSTQNQQTGSLKIDKLEHSKSTGNKNRNNKNRKNEPGGKPERHSLENTGEMEAGSRNVGFPSQRCSGDSNGGAAGSDSRNGSDSASIPPGVPKAVPKRESDGRPMAAYIRRQLDRIERLQSLEADLTDAEAAMLAKWHLEQVTNRNGLSPGKLSTLEGIEARIGPTTLKTGITRAEDKQHDAQMRLYQWLRTNSIFLSHCKDLGEVENHYRLDEGNEAFALATEKRDLAFLMRMAQVRLAA